MNKCQNVRALSFLFSLGLAVPAIAAGNPVPVKQTVQSYSVGLGATRIIYPPGSAGAVIAVNNPNVYPVLVQAEVMDASHHTEAVPFAVTPPLFRLDAHQQSRLRVVMTGDVAVRDRETLYWLCATGIPPEQGDAWAGDVAHQKNGGATIDVKIRMSQCIKLLVRPPAVKGTPDEVASSVIWQREGDHLVGKNPTPFYLNLSALTVAGKAISMPDYLPPLGSRTYTLPKGTATTGKVTWKIINDLGGVSRAYEAGIQ